MNFDKWRKIIQWGNAISNAAEGVIAGDDERVAKDWIAMYARNVLDLVTTAKEN